MVGLTLQVFHETAPSHLQIDKEMWGVERTDDVIVFHMSRRSKRAAPGQILMKDSAGRNSSRRSGG